MDSNFKCGNLTKLDNSLSRRNSTLENKHSPIPPSPGGDGFYTIRIRAFITADTNGEHDSGKDHPAKVNDIWGHKYRIEMGDIKKLVDGANEIYKSNKIRFAFDARKDIHIAHDTLLNCDTLTPGWLVESQSVFYRSAANEIFELWTIDNWEKQNLTKSASAPLATGKPSSYLTGHSLIKHVVYRGTDGHIHELFHESIPLEAELVRLKKGDDKRKWSHNSLTAQINVALAAGNPFAFTSFDAQTEGMDIQHVVYRGVDGHIHELFTQKEWHHNNLTIQANAPKAASDPYGYVTYNAQSGKLDILHVIYRGVDGHIHELFAGQTWKHNNLTAITGAPLANGNPTAYTSDYGSVQHVIYKSADGHIHELFARNEWKHNDLTSQTNAPLASGDPVGYTTNDYNFGVVDDQHIVYRGVDDHIHQLYTLTSWFHQDLTKLSGAPVAKGDPTAYTDASKQQQHVIFSDKSGNIQELYSTTDGKTWGRSLLTQHTGSPSSSQHVFGMFRPYDTLCTVMRNIKARTHPGELVVYFRYGGGGWSSSIDDFIVMASIWNPKDLTFLAHEIGHHLHLPHTFGGPSGNDVVTAIKNYVEKLALQQNNNTPPLKISQQIIDRGMEAIDGDYPTIKDTPAEPFGESDKDVKVTFSTGQVHIYQIKPDLQNVMNYLKKDGTVPAHFSEQQKSRMRDALEKRNRQHLIK